MKNFKLINTKIWLSVIIILIVIVFFGAFPVKTQAGCCYNIQTNACGLDGTRPVGSKVVCDKGGINYEWDDALYCGGYETGVSVGECRAYAGEDEYCNTETDHQCVTGLKCDMTVNECKAPVRALEQGCCQIIKGDVKQCTNDEAICTQGGHEWLKDGKCMGENNDVCSLQEVDYCNADRYHQALSDKNDKKEQRYGLLPSCISCGDCTLAEILSTFLAWYRFAFAGIGGFALIFLIFGGVRLLLSAGNPEAIQSGKRIILHTLIGVLILLGSWMVVNVIVAVLGDGTIGGIGKIFEGTSWSTPWGTPYQ